MGFETSFDGLKRILNKEDVKCKRDGGKWQAIVDGAKNINHLNHSTVHQLLNERYC